MGEKNNVKTNKAEIDCLKIYKAIQASQDWNNRLNL